MAKLKTMDELFKGRHFEREITILCVRWYLRYKLSYRDLVEMMAERGATMTHTTIMRWVQRYHTDFEQTPTLAIDAKARKIAFIEPSTESYDFYDLSDILEWEHQWVNKT